MILTFGWFASVTCVNLNRNVQGSIVLAQGGSMKRVIGLGGIFFKAKDPKALYEWYRKHLGIESNAGSGAMWRDADHPEIPGCNVFAIFPADTTYFAPSDSRFMINFRVDNLDELLTALRAE